MVIEYDTVTVHCYGNETWPLSVVKFNSDYFTEILWHKIIWGFCGEGGKWTRYHCQTECLSWIRRILEYTNIIWFMQRTAENVHIVWLSFELFTLVTTDIEQFKYFKISHDLPHWNAQY